MPRAVGLDIGSRMIKVVEINGTPKGFRIVRMVTRPVPGPESLEPVEPVEGEEAAGKPTVEDLDDRLSRVLRELFDEMKLPKEDVCAAIGSGSTVLREFPVPFKEEDQIRKVLRFEMENHLHSHAVEDMVVNGVKTGETREGSRMLGFATPKSDLLRRLAILRRAGIEPASVDLDTTAVYTACYAHGVFERHPNVIVLDIGAQTTNVVRVCDGRPRYFRSVLLGLSGVATAISKDLEVPIAEGRRQAQLASGARPGDLLIPSGVLDPDVPPGEKTLPEVRADTVEDRRLGFVRKLHQETHRSISAVSGEPPPERILVCGGGALMPGTLEALAEKIGLPVERLDLGGRVGDLGPEPEYAQVASPPAIGCALRMIGINPLGIELLQDEFAPTNVFDVVKTALATGVTLVFLLLLGLTIIEKSQLDAEKTRFNFVWGNAREIGVAAEKAYLQAVESKTDTVSETEARSYLTRQIPQDHTRLVELQKLLTKRYRRLEGDLGMAKDIPPVPSALEVWVEIVRALSTRPREDYGPWLQIKTVDVTPRQARVTIQMDSAEVFDIARAVFEKSEYFKRRARNPSQIVEPQDRHQAGGHWEQTFEFRFEEEN
jgi:type IV pilus assembly protein PilM